MHSLQYWFEIYLDCCSTQLQQTAIDIQPPNFGDAFRVPSQLVPLAHHMYSPRLLELLDARDLYDPSTFVARRGSDVWALQRAP